MGFVLSLCPGTGTGPPRQVPDGLGAGEGEVPVAKGLCQCLLPEAHTPRPAIACQVQSTSRSFSPSHKPQSPTRLGSRTLTYCPARRRGPLLGLLEMSWLSARQCDRRDHLRRRSSSTSPTVPCLARSRPRLSPPLLLSLSLYGYENNLKFLCRDLCQRKIHASR